MRDFLNSTKFKIIVCVVAVLLGTILYAASKSGVASLPEQIIGSIVTPIQKLSTSISVAASDFFDKFLNADQYKKENELLLSEIDKYRKEMIDYQKIKDENEKLNQIIGIKEANKDFELQSSTVIGRDSNEMFGSFTIDKGSKHGIALNDPVITDAGLVGIISEISPTFARVSTILSPERNVGSYEIKSKDIGIISGDVELAQKNLCRMSYIKLESEMKPGDMVVTSGLNGIFPKELIIGIVENVFTESYGTTLFAEIRPTVDIKEINDVFVITDFFGQGTGFESDIPIVNEQE